MYIKIHDPLPLDPGLHTFLYGLNIEKIEKIESIEKIIFHELEDMIKANIVKIIICKK